MKRGVGVGMGWRADIRGEMTRRVADSTRSRRPLSFQEEMHLADTRTREADRWVRSGDTRPTTRHPERETVSARPGARARARWTGPRPAAGRRPGKAGGSPRRGACHPPPPPRGSGCARRRRDGAPGRSAARATRGRAAPTRAPDRRAGGTSARTRGSAGGRGSLWGRGYRGEEGGWGGFWRRWAGPARRRGEKRGVDAGSGGM